MQLTLLRDMGPCKEVLPAPLLWATQLLLLLLLFLVHLTGFLLYITASAPNGWLGQRQWEDTGLT